MMGKKQDTTQGGGGRNNNHNESTLFKSICTTLVGILVVLALLPHTGYFSNWIKSDREASKRQGLSESPFFIAHVLDPSIEGQRYNSWNANLWREWLRRRDKAHEKADRKAYPWKKMRKNLPEKDLNSVMIATTLQFLNAFQSQIIQDSENRDEEYFYWSDVRFPSYVFANGRVYRCPPMFFNIKFKNGKPVHLHGHCHFKKKYKGNNNEIRINPKENCTEVK